MKASPRRERRARSSICASGAAYKYKTSCSRPFLSTILHSFAHIGAEDGQGPYIHTLSYLTSPSGAGVLEGASALFSCRLLIWSTQQTMTAYVEGLLGGGPYKRHFSENVVVSLEGSDQGAEGPDATEGWINYLHQEAFEARPEIKNVIIADGQAVAELDFVGKHVGEFGGIAATGKEVRVPYCVGYDLEGEEIRALRIYMPTDVVLRQLDGGPSPEQGVEPSH